MLIQDDKTQLNKFSKKKILKFYIKNILITGCNGFIGSQLLE